MGCLAEQTITEYVEGGLNAAAADEVESHIDGCADCRLAVAEAARGRIQSTLPEPLPSQADPLVGQPADRMLAFMPGAQVGRYIVRRIVGAGGMGVVYAAYDPKLDREVALKLLRPEITGPADARLDREAKLMARLAHPNVITVYDVGSIAGQVYVAMELVVGETLGHKLRSPPKKPWREVLALYGAAGRGLVAAHREGVIHRDFKPDNVLVGNDGRVRVTDFGLARVAHSAEPLPSPAESGETALTGESPLTRTGALLGTPAYMAPEQLLGQEADALSDQFGFCIALYEGLYGERPFAGATLAEITRSIERGEVRPPKDGKIPAWLRRVVLRGLAASPKARWPSMEALLDALGRDPAARWRRLAFVGVALILAVAAVGLSRLQQAERPCRGAAAQLAGVWDEPRRQAVQKAFMATGVPYAADAWRGVLRALDAYSDAWVRMHTEACEATRVRGEQSAELLDLRMHCLEKHRQDLLALVAVYAQADADVVERAVSAAPTPKRLRVCADARELLQPIPLPLDPVERARIVAFEQRLAGLRAQEQAGQYQSALKAADTAAADSVALAYAPVEAEAQLLLGDIQQTLGEYPAAESSFYRALWAGETGKQDRIAAQAWTRLVYVVGYSQERVSESPRLIQHAEAALRRLGGDDIESAALESAAGSIADKQGQYQEALRRFESSRALLEKTFGLESLELSEVLQRLALVLEPLGQWAEAIALERRALAILEQHFGPEHPQTADSRRQLAQHLFYNEYFEDALREAQHALATYEKSYPTDDDHVAAALLGVGEILLDMDRGKEALPLATRALEIRKKRRDSWHTDLAQALAEHSAALLQVGQTDAALVEASRVREIVARALGTTHIKYAWALADLGRIYFARGEYRRAYEMHRESLSVLEKSQLKDVWSFEKQRIEVGRSELMLGDGKSALATLERAVATLEKDDDIAIILGDAYFHLAEVLRFLGQDEARAQRLLRQAIVIYRRQQVGREQRILAVERFLAQKAPIH